MTKRVISSVLLWTVVGGLVYAFGVIAGVLLLAALSAASQFELYRLLEQSRYPTYKAIGTLLGTVLLLSAYPVSLPGLPAAPEIQTATVLALVLVVIFLHSVIRPNSNRTAAIAATVFGLVYIPFFLQFYIAILLLPTDASTGLLLAIWVVVTVKFCDVGGYIFGSIAGRHKLAPAISPGKTWEGVVGGIVVSALCSAGFAYGFAAHLPDGLTPFRAVLLAIPLAALGVVSDLVESVFKRQAGAKDSGNAIPGIGGALDLVDSLVLCGPLAYILLYFVV